MITGTEMMDRKAEARGPLGLFAVAAVAADAVADLLAGLLVKELPKDETHEQSNEPIALWYPFALTPTVYTFPGCPEDHRRQSLALDVTSTQNRKTAPLAGSTRKRSLNDLTLIVAGKLL